MWKGAVSFGLVHIPVKLYAATEDRDVHFRQLHASDHAPIRYAKQCSQCRAEVETHEIVRGYEYAPGEYVVVDDTDLANLPLPSAKTVEIVDFVQTTEIDPIYYGKTYFIGPAEGGAKPYALLREAMQRTRRAAVGKVAIRSKENLALLRVYGEQAIVLETLFYPDEIRAEEDIEGLTQLPQAGERELAMAVHLIESLATPFQPERYHDHYREALLDLIGSKVAGRQVVTPTRAEPRPVVDLMAALEESIKLAEERRHALAKGAVQ